MPVQSPQASEFLCCPICYNPFCVSVRRPISLGCGHTVCKHCLYKLQRKQCPFDQTPIHTDIGLLPENTALLQLVDDAVVGGVNSTDQLAVPQLPQQAMTHYAQAKNNIEELALFLKPNSGSLMLGVGLLCCINTLSRPMQRKLLTLINCQLVEEEGRVRALRATRSLGERSVTELILQHQNAQQLSANLWAAVRARGCQFLGPAMQEEVLKLVLLALEDGSALSRKVLVMYVVQRLAPHFPQASKTSIGHVVQLLYRASCFKVSKREGDSSLMQLKEEFRTYEALRREHDAQIVQIATEAGLRIAPEQWSSLLYGDTLHKSHMQSIIDKLQTPQSFSQSVQELVIALQRTGDPGNLSVLRPHLELLSAIDPVPDTPTCPTWEEVSGSVKAATVVVKGLVEFIGNFGNRKLHEDKQIMNIKYKTNMCRDLAQRGSCPRGANCTFAHSQDEMEKAKTKRVLSRNVSSNGQSNLEKEESGCSNTSNSSSSSGGSEVGGAYLMEGSSKALFCQALGESVVRPPPPTVVPPSNNGVHHYHHHHYHHHHTLNPDTPPFQPNTRINEETENCCGPQPNTLNKVNQKRVSLRSLQHRRHKLLAQLELYHRASMTTSAHQQNRMSNHGNEAELVMTSSGAFYSPWSSTNLFSQLPPGGQEGEEEATPTAEAKPRLLRPPYLLPSEIDEFIPFDPPLVSKYGPISRSAARLAYLRGYAAPFQVNSVMGELTSTSAVVRHPLSSTAATPSLYGQDDLCHRMEAQCQLRSEVDQLILQEELWAIEKTIQQKELMLVNSLGVEDNAMPIPTSVGPWPQHQLEQQFMEEEEDSDHWLNDFDDLDSETSEDFTASAVLKA